VIVQRILAILSAILLVAAAALGLLGLRGQSLAVALDGFDRTLLDHLRDLVMATLGGWTWANLVLPLLMRPVWLVPVCLGVIVGGLALSVPSRDPSERSHRRG